MTSTTTAPQPVDEIDPDRLQQLVEQAVGDFGSVLNASLVVIGDRLGLYRALADAGLVDVGRARRARPAPSSATSASGSRPRLPPATSPTTATRERRPLVAVTRAGPRR